MVFRHHNTGTHPARFAHVNLVWPAAAGPKLIGAKAEATHLPPYRGRHSFVAGKEMKISSQVTFVRQLDLSSLLPVAQWIPVTRAQEIERDGPPVVEVPLAIGKRIVFHKI